MLFVLPKKEKSWPKKACSKRAAYAAKSEITFLGGCAEAFL